MLERGFAVQFGPTDLSFDNLLTLTAMARTVTRLRERVA